MTTNNNNGLPKINENFRSQIIKDFKEDLMSQSGMTPDQAEIKINELETARTKLAIKGTIGFNRLVDPQPSRLTAGKMENVIDLTNASAMMVKSDKMTPQEQQMLDNAILNKFAYAGKDGQTHIGLKPVYDSQSPEFSNKTIRIVDKNMDRAFWPSDLKANLGTQPVVVYFVLEGYKNKRTGSWVESIRPTMLQVADLDNIQYYEMGSGLPSANGLPKSVSPQQSAPSGNPYGTPQGGFQNNNNFGGQAQGTPAQAQGFNQAPMSSNDGFQPAGNQEAPQFANPNSDYSDAPLENEGENPFGPGSEAF